MDVHVDEAFILTGQNNTLGIPAKPNDEAAIKADLLRQLETASNELSTQLEALRRSTSPEMRAALDRGESRLSMLNALRDQLVGGAKGVDALRADISAAIAATRAYASEARGAAADAQGVATAQAALQQASAAARSSVMDFTRDYYEKRIFDPYLRFASAEDEDAYRRREEERRLAIENALAEGTPQGNLRANTLAIAQMNDAGRHGADRSPEFKTRYDELVAKQNQLTATLAPAPEKATVTAEADPFDTMKSTAGVPPELLARFRSTGTIVADQHGSGHGVNTAAPSGPRERT